MSPNFAYTSAVLLMPYAFSFLMSLPKPGYLMMTNSRNDMNHPYIFRS